MGMMRYLFVSGLLLIQSVVYACGGTSQQVYAGKIEYSLDSLNPFSCTVTVTMDFDVEETLANDSIWVYWGDEHVDIIRGISITEDSTASQNMGRNIFTHVYRGNHIYASLPAGGYYNISFPNEYRINGINNIASGDGFNLPFYLGAAVSIDTTAGGQYSALAFPPLSLGFANFSTYAQSGLQQTGTDSVQYSFMAPLETLNNPAPLYQFPDQFCVANGAAVNAFTIDPANGAISWADPCFQGIYCFGTVLNKYRHGHLISSIMREQNIYVSVEYVNGVQKIAKADILKLYPDPAANILSGNIDETSSLAACELNIIAPDGRIVECNIPVKEGRFEKDISHLTSGLYFLSLQSASERVIQKFIKQ